MTRALPPELLARVEREVSRVRPTRLTPEAIDWRRPDPAMFWIPEEVTPLGKQPVYGELDEAQRLRYNQYYALHMSEQFIWLEGAFSIAPIRRLLRAALPSERLRPLLESFVADEQAHNAALRRLVETARPDLYRDTDFAFFLPSRRFRWYARAVTQWPRLTPAFFLFIGTLEEHTILMCRLYRDAEGVVDPVFRQVYSLHAIDEARHCSLDAVISTWLLEGMPAWRSRVNAGILDWLFRGYFDPSWGYDAVVRRLVADFPALARLEAEMVRQTIAARSGAYFADLFSEASSPIANRNARQFPMLGAAIRRLGAG